MTGKEDKGKGSGNPTPSDHEVARIADAVQMGLDLMVDGLLLEFSEKFPEAHQNVRDANAYVANASTSKLFEFLGVLDGHLAGATAEPDPKFRLATLAAIFAARAIAAAEIARRASRSGATADSVIQFGAASHLSGKVVGMLAGGLGLSTAERLAIASAMQVRSANALAIRHKDNRADKEFVLSHWRENKEVYGNVKNRAAKEIHRSRLIQASEETIRKYLRGA